jgi:hypothetical protein
MSERELSIPGIQGRVTVSPPGLFRGAEVRVDGAPAKRKGWGKLLLPRADGSLAEARLVDHFTRTVPSLQIGSEKHEAGEAIPPLQVVFALLPFVLLVIGGAIGGACGAVAFVVNQGVIRSQKAPALKLMLMLGSTLVAAAVYFVLAGLFYATTH